MSNGIFTRSKLLTIWYFFDQMLRLLFFFAVCFGIVIVRGQHLFEELRYIKYYIHHSIYY